MTEAGWQKRRGSSILRLPGKFIALSTQPCLGYRLVPRENSETVTPMEPASVVTTRWSVVLAVTYALVGLTGAAGLIYQVIWQRYLMRLIGAEISATAVILAVFLGGLSLGYLVCGRLSARLRRP